MFDFSRIQNYFIQTGYTDMRLQIDGLVAKVQLEHGRQMEETSIYLFCGSRIGSRLSIGTVQGTSCSTSVWMRCVFSGQETRMS